MPAEIDYALHQIDRFLDNHNLGEVDVGILRDIHVDDRRTARIEGNVRCRQCGGWNRDCFWNIVLCSVCSDRSHKR